MNRMLYGLSLGGRLIAGTMFSLVLVAADKGPVTVWFQGGPSAVSDKLAILCSDRKANIVEQDDRHLLCQREVTGGKGILAQALLGNSSSTSPQLMIRFAILRDGTAVRVQASQWLELEMAGGQTRRNPLDSDKQRSQLIGVLTDAGATLSPPSGDQP